MRLRLALVLVFVLSLRARADTTRLTIMSDGCAPGDVRAQIVDQLGRDPFDESGKRRIAITIRATAATLTIDGGRRGERTIVAESCAELAKSLGVVVVMTLSQKVEPPPAQPESDPIAVGIFVAGAADLGGTTHVATGLDLWRGRISISAEVRLDLPHDVADGMIRVVRGQVSASPCLRALGFGACVVGSVGVLRGMGVDVLEPRTAVTPTLAIGARVVWQYDLTRRFALRLHADAVANLIETRLDLDDMPAWSSPRVEGLLGAGVLARFR